MTMAQNTVRIENYYGKTVQATVLEEVNDGPLKGWNYLQMPDGSKCHIARRWCLPLTADGSSARPGTTTDTDWRRFLRTHWDTRRNHLQADATGEFIAIFTRAAAAYYARHNQKPNKPNEPNEPIMPNRPNEPIMPNKPSTPITTHSPQKPHYIQLSLFPTI